MPERRYQRSVVAFDGRRWDVSNLNGSNCRSVAEGATNRERHRIRPRNRNSPRSRSKTKGPWVSIYPLPSEIPAIPLAEKVFEDNSIQRMHRHSGMGMIPCESQQHFTPHPQPHDETPQFDRRMVEVASGHFVVLRGSEETWHALQNNMVASLPCSCCETMLHCIQDASMVLCPECKMISPLMDGGDGLGLGVKAEGNVRPTLHWLGSQPSQPPQPLSTHFSPSPVHSIEDEDKKPAPIDYSSVQVVPKKKERTRINYDNVVLPGRKKSEERISQVDRQAFSRRFRASGE